MDHDGSGNKNSKQATIRLAKHQLDTCITLFFKNKAEFCLSMLLFFVNIVVAAVVVN